MRVGSTNQELLEELWRFARGETSSARGNPCAFPWSALARLAILCRRPLETGVDQIVEGHSIGMVREVINPRKNGLLDGRAPERIKTRGKQIEH